MNRTYQPFIVEMAKQYVEVLGNELDFYEEEKITTTEYSKQLFCEKLTEKFLDGQISSDDGINGIFNEDEFSGILNQIHVQNTLDGLVNKGLINYIEDDNGEEMYFLTKKGKLVAEKMDINTGNTVK